MKNEQSQRRETPSSKGGGGRRACEAEFHEFVVARWPRLVRTAYLLTGDRHHAEDLAQATLAKLRLHPALRAVDPEDLVMGVTTT